MRAHAPLRPLAVWLCCAFAGCAAVPPAPAPAGPEIRRIAFGSCAVQTRPQPIWDVIAKDRPDVFVFAGDNVYGDLADEAQGSPLGEGGPESLARAYAALGEVETFRGFRESVPILPVWDDHDYGQNDAGGDYVHREDAERQFLDFWRIGPDDPRAQRPGVYHVETFGAPGRRVQIVLLDTRSFRSPLMRDADRSYIPDPDPAKTMLGVAQWAWLADTLRQPADVRLIVSSIQVLAQAHPFERWDTLPRERERLFRLIEETGAGGVILLSGDRHRGALYALRKGVPYPLYELTSSSLNLPFADPDEQGPQQLGPMFGEENYGRIDIDWDAGRVTLSLRDGRGQEVRSTTIPIRALSRRR